MNKKTWKTNELKCVHCGKIKWHHKANTLACPVGPKYRTMGYLQYSEVNTYTEKAGPAQD